MCFSMNRLNFLTFRKPLQSFAHCIKDKFNKFLKIKKNNFVKKFYGMISFEDALEKVLTNTISFETERIELKHSLNHILAEPVFADIEMPPFNKAAVDGFACRSTDLALLLKEIEVIKAGDEPKSSIIEGTCARIMTGAKVPENADCVIPFEDSAIDANGFVRFSGKNKPKNIAFKAEDVKFGDLVLAANTFIKPQHIAILASMGIVEPLVFKMPKIGIITTGDEIVEPNIKPNGTKIRNSNASQLWAQLANMGITPKYYGIVGDEGNATKDFIANATSENDIVLITGGVSMGDYDFVPEALTGNGFEILFDSVAIKPGKPTTFAKNKNKVVFGLPGNPVSSFVIFELFVKPYIYRCMGNTYHPLNIVLPMGVEYSRKGAERKSWVPIFINDNGDVMPVEYHGSGHIHSITFADGMIAIERGMFTINKGEMVRVRLF